MAKAIPTSGEAPEISQPPVVVSVITPGTVVTLPSGNTMETF